MKRIPRRIFTEEFKREAIKLVTEQGLTMAEAGRKLDIATKSLRTWVGQRERGQLKASLGASKLTADQQRIRELERELAIAKMERDILNCSHRMSSRRPPAHGTKALPASAAGWANSALNAGR